MSILVLLRDLMLWSAVLVFIWILCRITGGRRR